MDLDLYAEALEKASEERAGLIASRAGEVLGAHTILKEDHFPGCQSAKLPDTIPGAPNFRGVPGQNVYGSALPTVEGIKEVLKHVGAGADAHDKRKVQKNITCVNISCVTPCQACLLADCNLSHEQAYSLPCGMEFHSAQRRFCIRIC